MTFEGTAELDFKISCRFLRKIVRETLVFCDVLFHTHTRTRTYVFVLYTYTQSFRVFSVKEMKVLFMYMHFNYIYWLGVIFIRVVPGIANNANNKIKFIYIVLNPWEKN